MNKDYSNKNLRKASFKGEDLSHARFNDSDLRGADFSGANLSSSDFTHIKTGVPPVSTVLIFLCLLLVSAFSGYIAMLAGRTVQFMLASKDPRILTSGYLSIALTILFILFSYWKGVGNALKDLFLPVIVLALFLSVIAWWSGLGTGRGMLFLALALFLVAVMFVVGTLARTVAGSLSNIIFLIVAVFGSLAGRSLGGGFATVIMALACAQISKKALKGKKGFESLQKVAHYLTSKYGTSFRQAHLMETDFSGARMQNCDFTDAEMLNVHWNENEVRNCVMNKTGGVKDAIPIKENTSK